MLEKKQVITEDEKIDKILTKGLKEHYNDKEEFEKDFVNILDNRLKEMEEGKYLTSQQIIKGLEEKYHIKI